MFIFFSVRDAREGKMKRFKEYKGLYQIKSIEDRMRAAQLLADEFAQKLRNGWTPFWDDQKVIYADQLQYRSIIDIYKNKRKNNRTFHCQ